MVARVVVASALLCLGLAACASGRSDTVIRIALLAPFEGRNREIGYNALYAVRLAIAEYDAGDLVLLAVDDGGTPAASADRMRALTADPGIVAVIAAGEASSTQPVQQASAGLPVLVAGYWRTPSLEANVFVVTHPDMPDLVLLPDVVGIWGTTAGYPLINMDYANQTVVAGSSLPDAAFRTRYLESDPFAPEPGIIAVSAYQTTQYLLAELEPDVTRQSLVQTLSDDFAGGFLIDARLFMFDFDDDGQLFSVERVIE